MKRKRMVLYIAAFLLLWTLSASADGAAKNLILGGDFSSLNTSGMPSGWYTEAWINTVGYTEYRVEQTENGNVATIINLAANDARFAQVVDVEPSTLYCLSAMVRADAKNEGRGANLSVEGLYVFSSSLYDTDGAFTELKLYGMTGPDQRSLTVYARLGGYSGETEGEASFSDVRMEKVGNVPEGYSLELFYEQKLQPVTESESDAQDADIALITVLAVLSLLVMAFAAWRMSQAGDAGTLTPLHESRNEYLPLGILLAGALLIRLIIAAWVPGFGVDIGCFSAWASRMASVGPQGFYAQDYFCDYPPGYMLILGVIGLIGNASGGVNEMMVKSVPIFADLCTLLLLYVCTRRLTGARVSLWLCVLYALSPAVLLSGAAWGQADSALAALLLCVCALAIAGRWHIALPVFVLAALTKPQALLFGPLGLCAAICETVIWYQAKPAKPKTAGDFLWRTVPGKMVAGLVFALAAALLVALPFSAGRGIGWLLELYGGTVSYYNYATINAANVYYLAGANWTPLTAQAPIALSSVTALVMLGYGAYRLSKGARDVPGWICLAAGGVLMIASLLFPLTYAALGFSLIALCVGTVMTLYVLGGDKRNLPLAGGVLLTMLFTLGTQMHERYAYCAVALFLLAYALNRDRRLIYLAIGISVTTLVNAGLVLDLYTRYEATGMNAYPGADLLATMCAVINCALTALAFHTLCDICVGGRVLSFQKEHNVSAAVKKTPPAPARDTLLSPQAARRMTRRDYMLILPLTALYAVLAFWNLGSTRAPQTDWGATAVGEQVVIDLGESRDFHFLYYTGIQNGDYSMTVEASEDGVTFDQAASVDVNYYTCFSWNYIELYRGMPKTMTGRYIRLTAHQVALNLFEVSVRDAETGEELPLTLHSVTGRNEKSTRLGAPERLVDEPGMLQGEPGWYNSTYFDEIYHARTGYEHLMGIAPYETTHPPLGKLIISAFIALFGMTPFGWRFGGALAGVLMLPGMYVLGKSLSGRRTIAFTAALLMALDCMHYAQTRIATIDSYIVLFSIWSFAMMFRYVFMDHFGEKIWRTLVPLGLSGVMIALAIASKWTGLYAGLGLAIIFFASVLRQFMQSRRARAMLETKRVRSGKDAPALIPAARREAVETAAYRFYPRMAVTLAACVIFFVLIPLLVFYLSYIPYFAPTGGVTVQRVIDAQIGAYNYHSQPRLGMDHLCYSPWYEWLLSLTPMYFAVDYYEPAGLTSSILSFGNLWIWWTGALALVAVVYIWCAAKRTRLLGVCDERAADLRPGLLLIAFAAQYLPWVLVPRGMYIYHYFPSLPFVMLCLCLIADRAMDRAGCAAEAPRGLSGLKALPVPQRTAWLLLLAYLVIALIFFIAFFPYASGIMVPEAWRKALQWFPNWLYY